MSVNVNSDNRRIIAAPTLFECRKSVYTLDPNRPTVTIAPKINTIQITVFDDMTIFDGRIFYETVQSLSNF